MRASIRTERRGNTLVVLGEDFRLVFDSETSGFPTSLAYADEPDRPLFVRHSPWFEARLGGAIIRPVLADLAHSCFIRRVRDMLVVTFPHIAWQDASGKPLDGFRLGLQYRIHADGVVFTTIFFTVDHALKARIHDARLMARLELSPQERAHWAFWEFPSAVGAPIIQTIGGQERMIAQGAGRSWSNTLVPYVSFDFGADNRRDRHLEFFMESWNSFTADYKNTAASVTWKGQTAELNWTIHKAPVAPAEGRPYQWRNTWGWVLRRYQAKRARPPARVLHYFDLHERHPSKRALEEAAAEGANTLILHEGWRLDMKQAEFAWDETRLRRMVKNAHNAGLRVMLYVRGNEDAQREFAGALLPGGLRRNFDGIYMDFGLAYVFTSQDEYWPGGRIHFETFDKLMRNTREVVGPKGLFIAHAGPFFSAVGYTTVDAYLGGEQEKGRLIENPTVHSYFSGLSVAPSALWTAAFPPYRTAQSRPYLAAATQTPFLHIGAQMASSSLAHPASPSAVTFARPLWRLWELMDGERNLEIYSSEAGPQVCRADSAKTGVAIWKTSRDDYLVIAANYSQKPRDLRIKLTGFKAPTHAFALWADDTSCRSEKASASSVLARRAGGLGLAAWLLTNQPLRFQARLRRFARPYPKPSKEAGNDAAEQTAEQARRFDPPAWDRHFLRVSIPEFMCNYEDSLWLDLYQNAIALLDFSLPGAPRMMGYISRKGLSSKPPRAADLLLPGMATPWIQLPPWRCHARSTCATRRLGIKTRRTANDPESSFYSLVLAELSPEPKAVNETYALRFRNDTDPDWSLLRFDLRKNNKKKQTIITGTKT